jgi:hypothetical protein
MTTVWIDPAELERTAALLQSLSRELNELANELGPACCCCEMPSSVAGYVTGEVGSARSGAATAGTGYLSAANDLTARADLVSADASLVGAASAAWGGGATMTIGGGGTDWLTDMTTPTTMTIGGGGTDWLTDMAAPTTMTIGGNSGGWLSDMATPTSFTVGGGTMPSWYTALSGINSASMDPATLNILTSAMSGGAAAATWFAPQGVSASDGPTGFVYTDPSGNSSTNIASFYADPISGDYYTH